MTTEGAEPGAGAETGAGAPESPEGSASTAEGTEPVASSPESGDGDGDDPQKAAGNAGPGSADTAGTAPAGMEKAAAAASGAPAEAPVPAPGREDAALVDGLARPVEDEGEGRAPEAPVAAPRTTPDDASAPSPEDTVPAARATAQGAAGPGATPGHAPGARDDLPADVPTGRHAAGTATDGEPGGAGGTQGDRPGSGAGPDGAASGAAGHDGNAVGDPAAPDSGGGTDGRTAAAPARDAASYDPAAPARDATPDDPAAPDGRRGRAPAEAADPAAPANATPDSGGGTPPKRSAVAEALAAAVRAVESGERSAASFFTEPARPAARAPRRVSRAAAPAVEGPLAEAPLDEEVLAEVRRVLVAGGAPESLAGAVVTALGEQAAEALREDPWLLLGVAGVRPEQADGFARALLGDACGPGDARRARALVGRLLERAALAGHTVLEASALREELARRAVPDPDEALGEVIADGSVLVFQEPLRAPETPEEEAGEAEVPVRTLLGLDRYAMAEESLADGLARLLGTLTARDLDWEGAAAAAPSPSAAELIRAVAASGLVAHSGGEAARAEPAAVVAAARALGLRAVAAAFTEDGRRRLAAAGDAEAVTVAGLLAGREGPERDAEGALAVDLLAVLDAPRLDVETAAALVESLPDGARLVLSGDPAELGPAGPGRVFGDVLAARACPVVVSRTPDPGPLGELLSGIGAGELLRVDAPGKEVVIVPVRDAGEAVHRTVQLVADSVPRAIGVPPEATQVVTVGHGGAVGTRALNAALKERLNPGPGRFGGFDPGDRIAYVPAPGRMVPGTVVSGDADGLRLDCSGTQVVVPPGRVADAVRHGWAVTAHQAAGTRWPAAVVVLPGDAGPGLTRSWVYTAFGRGERHLSVVHGVGQDLPRAVAEVPAKERSTRLRTLLKPQTAPAG
ncbi:AAA family ATPase [Streptomyces sp. TYQ1024]|nr:AAA family ATPase [Streptomyces sp. TYQ1024]